MKAAPAVRTMATAGAERWERAVVAVFLDGARDGSLDPASFDRWLAQDRLFLVALARAWARVLAGAPEEDLAFLAGGIAAFTAEIEWLESVAAARGIEVTTAGAAVEPATAAYGEWLHEVSAAAYPVGLAAMWAVEAAYLEAWTRVRPGHGDYQDFVDHWTSPEFAAFVGDLEARVDRELRAAPDGVQAAARDAVLTTLDHEAAFWRMADGVAEGNR